jgi:hypothetical protein
VVAVLVTGVIMCDDMVEIGKRDVLGPYILGVEDVPRVHVGHRSLGNGS